MKNTKKIISKLMGINPKEETLSTIFLPLNGIEEKVTIRKATLEEKILLLQEKQETIIKDIRTYREESEKCVEYLITLSKLK